MGKSQNKLFEEKQFVSKNVFGWPEKVESADLGASQSVLNISLLLLIGVLAIWYALWANFVISGQYRENLLKEKLENLVQENNQLLSERSGLANLGALLVFAKSAGLVEQKNIEYLFDRRNVAEVPSDLAH